MLPGWLCYQFCLAMLDMLSFGYALYSKCLVMPALNAGYAG
jgi:hypothetical protein